ncbi:LysM peptidoglycan-binding domain-containing protein [Panacibacter ginsenosidivorans]|uniref:Peptidoglycan hydrolase n=1 Tax=Panacibacter ginsenosidivorans TaxID=1813871 RepID=A0A5B8VA75_9BACT|nr:glucosaminidase domain-containing protein [Panacibacter ginsenosidivorans]QEC67761.1 LysM peptidoglycan-binding domain-containing protein [Panacibacter ginsenosidivorans]
MKRFSLLIFPLFFLMTYVSAQTNDAVQQYIEKYKEIAINEEIRTGVPAAITLAQGIFESMAGQSDLALASNNHFGIKCKENWTGKKVYHDDDSRGECFRSYTTVEESYRDHSDFLKSRPNYTFLFTIDPSDYKAWAYGLKKAGYATNPVYAQAIIKKIEDNDLQQYTLIAMQRGSGVQPDVAVNNTPDKPVMNTVVAALPDVSAIAIQSAEKPSAQETVLAEYNGEGNYPIGMFTINQTKTIYAAAGTSLFALASNNNIALEKLLEFNEIDNSDDILAQGQLIYLEKKSKKSNTKDFHIVAPNETIETIAQREGIQLESLFEYNKMQKGLEPAPGEKVYLKPGRQTYYPKLLPKNNAKIG